MSPLKETARREPMLAKVEQLLIHLRRQKLLQRTQELLRCRSSHRKVLMTRRLPARDSAGLVMKPA